MSEFEDAESFGITMTVLKAHGIREDEDGWKHHAFDVRLESPTGSLTLPYRMGVAFEGAPPELGMVLDLLRMDAWGLAEGDTFESWAEAYGYDTDSRRMERIYREVETNTAELRAMLGDQWDRFADAAEIR